MRVPGVVGQGCVDDASGRSTGAGMKAWCLWQSEPLRLRVGLQQQAWWTL